MRPRVSQGPVAVAWTQATHLPPSRQSIYNGDVYTKSVPADMIETIRQIPNAVLQGDDASKAANRTQKEVVSILNG